MATTQKAAAKRAAKTANPNPAGEALKEMEQKQSTLPDAPPSNEAKDDKRFLAVSEGACLNALQRAFTTDRDALHLEIAISLTVFAYAEGGATKEAKARMIVLYGEAGYDVADSKSADYKTIWRRTDAAAKLFQKLGKRWVIGAMDGRTEGEAITKLKDVLLEEFNFRGINSVYEQADKAVKQTNTPEYRERKRQEAAQADADRTQAQANAPQGETAGSAPGGNSKDSPGAELTPEGQRVNQDGSIDKRTAPEGGQSEATQQAQAATPQDQATAAKLGERMEQARAEQGDDGRRDRRFVDRAENFATVIQTDGLHLAIPHGTTKQALRDLLFKAMMFMESLPDDDTEKKGTLHASNQGQQRREAAAAH